MSSRGRGFNSRGGSYRGRGGGNWDSGSGGNMNRGGYGSSRGGGGRFKYSTPSYDSRNKYNSSGSERSYSSRGARGDHSNNYKRPRESYSARDDHRSSNDTNRKRIRGDSYQGEGGGGSQRYGSSSYGGGSGTSTPYNDNKRSSSSAVYDDKRQSDRPSSYHRNDERHTSTSRNYTAPPPPRISEMAPPSQRYTSSRGRISHQSTNYRGRLSTRGRAGFRIGASRSDILSRKRTLTSTLDYRRKLATRSRDYIQRVRLTTPKMRRSGTTRLSGSKKDSAGPSLKDKDRELAKAINAEFSDDDDDDEDDKHVEENWDDDDKVMQPANDEIEDAEADKKMKEEKRKKEKQERQNSDELENMKIKEENITIIENTDKSEHGDDAEDPAEQNIKEEGRESDDLPSRRDGRRFIKLHCPHCSHRSVTFKEYSLHLFSSRHNAAMRQIAARHKAHLARMRVLQRQEQRRNEAKEAARGTLPSRTMFCQICKLNYRSLKAMHHMSESHRQMKRFLTPFCRVCRLQFRSPMLFETHACSLDHIKRKSVMDARLIAGNGDADGDSSAPEEDDKEVNLDNFMTLDSVGDVDAEEEEDTSEKKKKDKPESEETSAEAEKKPKHKQTIKCGSEYIKRVEVQFCELCKVYLSRNESAERAIALHCSTRPHLKRYVRNNDDQKLRREAERIHLQSSSSTNNTSTNSTSASDATKTTPAANSAATAVAPAVEPTADTVPPREAAPKTVTPEPKSKSAKSGDEEDDEYHNDGDKLWEDVDKDLGDILREVEPGKSSDDEDSRYDRFKNSDKKAQHNKEKTNDNGEGEKPKKNESVKAKAEETAK